MVVRVPHGFMHAVQRHGHQVWKHPNADSYTQPHTNGRRSRFAYIKKIEVPKISSITTGRHYRWMLLVYRNGMHASNSQGRPNDAQWSAVGMWSAIGEKVAACLLDSQLPVNKRVRDGRDWWTFPRSLWTSIWCCTLCESKYCFIPWISPFANRYSDHKERERKEEKKKRVSAAALTVPVNKLRFRFENPRTRQARWAFSCPTESALFDRCAVVDSRPWPAERTISRSLTRRRVDTERYYWLARMIFDVTPASYNALIHFRFPRRVSRPRNIPCFFVQSSSQMSSAKPESVQKY